MRVKFVYEGHRVKVNVTGAENGQYAYSRNVNFDFPNAGSTKDRAIRFVQRSITTLKLAYSNMSANVSTFNLHKRSVIIAHLLLLSSTSVTTYNTINK